MKYKANVYISKAVADEINHFLTVEPKDESECLPLDITLMHTAKFEDGKEMDIKCCGVEFREGECNKAWSEAVLFDSHGCELCYTDVEEDKYLGEWELNYDGNTYVANVIVKDE